MKVKVLTGKIRERRVTLARSKAAKALSADGWKMLYVNPELHPAEIVETVDKLIEYAKTAGDDKVFFLSNCDHVFNRIRVLRVQGVVDEAEFVHFWIIKKTVLDNTGAAKVECTLDERHLQVMDNGECTDYPNGFLEEWNNQLLQLLAYSDANQDSGESSCQV